MDWSKKYSVYNNDIQYIGDVSHVHIIHDVCFKEIIIEIFRGIKKERVIFKYHDSPSKNLLMNMAQNLVDEIKEKRGIS